MGKLTKLAALLAAAGLVMVGCGDDSDDGGTNAPPAPVYSLVRIQAQIIQNNQVHPKLANQVLVGILRKAVDSTRIQTKASAAMVDTFTLWFDSLVLSGDSVIIDAFVDTDGDREFDPPASATDGWTLWPEPAIRWVLDSVAHDSAGSHGVQLTYYGLQNDKTDISDMP